MIYRHLQHQYYRLFYKNSKQLIDDSSNQEKHNIEKIDKKLNIFITLPNIILP